MLIIHILAGLVALLSGFIALFAAKGGTLHRRGGNVFVGAMLTMCAFGLILALWRDRVPSINVPAALITAYCVVTAWTTVRPLRQGQRRVDMIGMVAAGAVALVCFGFGLRAVATPGGFPAFPYFMFAAVAALGALGDARRLRRGAAQGAPRIVRHLWRMGYALFVATASLFLGQADVFPPPLRIPALLALPVLTVVSTTLYWAWRVRFGRRPTAAAMRRAS